MTVATTNRKNSFPTNGVTVDFPFTFAVTSKEQIFALTRNGAGDEADYTNFEIVLNESTAGGTFTTLDTLDDVTLVIYRDTPLTQNLDLVEGGRFPANSLEDSIDKLTLQNQDQQEDIERTLKYGIGTPEEDILSLEEYDKTVDDRDAATLQAAKDFTYSREVIDDKDEEARQLAAQDTAEYAYSKPESHQIFEAKAPVDTQSYVQRGGQWVPITGVPFFRVGCGESYMECGEPEAISGDFDFLYPQGFTPNS